ncbi:MAG: hypothetical protein JWM51_772 [Microbacteriaceae bacterium]|jgi:hypothetical protein|nr:hypothetical protein [Microbacteriaceae bacterium]
MYESETTARRSAAIGAALVGFARTPRPKAMA